MSKKIHNKRRHLVATASSAIMATAMLAAPSQAQTVTLPAGTPSIVVDSDMDSIIQAHIVGGDTLPQTNAADVTADASVDATITNDGNATGTFENNENAADAEAMGNRDGVSASLVTIGSSTLPDDGIALSSGSINEGIVAGAIISNADNSGIGFTATDFISGSVDVSGNSVTATTVVNLGSGTFEMAINGSEPVGYANLGTTNAAVLADLSSDLTNYASLSGTLLISSVQESVSGEDSQASAEFNDVFIDIDRTGDADVTGTLTLDDNTIAADFTGNDRTASIAIAADDANSSVTAAISNVQFMDANDNLASAVTRENTIIGRVLTDDFGFGEDTTSFVDSSLSVSDNEVTASATGNRATTDISLADGLAYNTAAGNDAVAVIDENDEFGDKIVDVQASAGLVGSNTQLVETGDIRSVLDFNTIDTEVQSMESSTIDMSRNRMVAAATGNNLDAAITSGANSATFDASAALVSRQELNGVLVEAFSYENDVESDFGGIGEDSTFFDSTVTFDANVLASSATGNRSRQDISLSAVDLTLVGGEDGARLAADLTPGEDGAAVFADGAVVIANGQLNNGSDVRAYGEDNDLRVDGSDNLNGTANNTSIAFTNNVQQSFAAGSDAGNSINLSGVDVGTGAGIANLQSNINGSDVSAFLSVEAEIQYDEGMDNSSAVISENEQSAVARGAVAANTLNVDAQSITTFSVNGGNTAETNFEFVSRVAASYGIANTQGLQGDVTAEVRGDFDSNLEVEVDWDLENSTIELVDNTVLAQAQGVVATNGLTLDTGSLNSVVGEDDAAISNLQRVDGSDIFAQATGQDEYIAHLDLREDVFSSSTENSRNDIIASAESARARNSLTVNATSIDSQFAFGTGTSDAYPGDNANDVDAQLAVVNTQYGNNGTVIATLRGDNNDGDFNDSATVYTDINETVSNSSIASDGNLLQAMASGNRSTNVLDVNATTLTDLTSGLSNAQINGQDVSALIGYTGTDGTPGTAPFTVLGNTDGLGTWTGDLTGLTSDQLAAFQAQFPGGNYTNLAAVTFSFPIGFTGPQLASINGTGPTEGTRLAGGVLIEVFDGIVSSNLTVEGNNVQGSALGNAATNTVSVDATAIDGRDGFADAASWSDETGSPEAEANADTTLASSQVLLAGSSSTTDVVNLFGIDGQTDLGVSDSQLSVSDNTQFGEAIGNTVVNSLTVSGTDLNGDATSGALANSQTGVAAVSANSEMEVFANAVSSASNITMDNNANTALAVVNNAVNTLTSSSTNSASSSQAFADSWLADGDTANADGSFVLVNAQNAGGTLTSTATTNVYNVDRLDTTTTGLVDGSVSQSSNDTRAEATANRATNTMNLSASANLGSTGALLNQQYSSTATSANASSNISLGLNGDVNSVAVDSSSISIEDNSTLALARGNSASNTLNYTAGANYTAQAEAAYADPTYAEGDAALLNDQVNTGSVSATATGATSVALNALNGSVGSVLNSSISNSNNSVAAYAYGNSASNTVMLSALNTGTANVALGNQQLNTGAVTATATQVSYTMSSFGSVTGASMQNNGNVASAVAVGNSSVSIIGGQ
jgi:hypothetical protein